MEAQFDDKSAAWTATESSARDGNRVYPLLWRQLGRWLLWLLVALLLVRGAADLIAPRPPAAAPVPPPAVPEWTDRQAYEAQAVFFVRDYLTWRPGQGAERAARLRTWAAPDVVDRLESDLDSGVGEQSVAGAWAQGSRRLDGTRVLVTVAAQVTTADPVGARWLWLAVPVNRQGRGYGVYDLPTAVPAPEAPARAASAADGREQADPGGEVRDLVDSFLRAYAQGTSAQLRYFLAPGTALAGLGGVLEYAGLDDLRVLSSEGGSRALAVAVLRDPVSRARLHQRFVLDLVRQQERWVIKDMLESGV